MARASVHAGSCDALWAGKSSSAVLACQSLLKSQSMNVGSTPCSEAATLLAESSQVLECWAAGSPCLHGCDPAIDHRTPIHVSASFSSSMGLHCHHGWMPRLTNWISYVLSQLVASSAPSLPNELYLQQRHRGSPCRVGCCASASSAAAPKTS